MLTPMFKRYCANVVIGGFYGMTVGAGAGAAAGKVGLNQYCRASVDLYASPACHAIEDEVSASSVRLGMLTGGALGLVTGAAFYPAYKLFVSYFYEDEPNFNDQELLDNSSNSLTINNT